MDELRFDDKVVVVTGGGRGLGAAYARLLAARGASVVVNDVGRAFGADTAADPAGELVAELEAGGAAAVADRHDVVTDAAAVVESAVEAFGGVDVVINNAGFAGGGTFAGMDPDAFDEVADVHIKGTRAVTLAAWPYLVDSGSGRIVNTASNAVLGGPGITPYSTGKAAVFGFTRSLAFEARRHGIGVNVIMPCAHTRLTAALQLPELVSFLEQECSPEAIAPFVAWLGHESCRLNGECFSVGGGRAARVVLAENPGVALPGGGTPEQWATLADQLLDVSRLEVLGGMIDEVEYLVEELGGPARIVTGRQR